MTQVYGPDYGFQVSIGQLQTKNQEYINVREETFTFVARQGHRKLSIQELTDVIQNKKCEEAKHALSYGGNSTLSWL